MLKTIRISEDLYKDIVDQPGKTMDEKLRYRLGDRNGHSLVTANSMDIQPEMIDAIFRKLKHNIQIMIDTSISDAKRGY